MKKYEDDIRNTLSHAKRCYDAWWLFTGKHPKREQIKFVHNKYLIFFDTLRPALYCTFAIKLSSLFSTIPKDITLDKLHGIQIYPEFNDLWDRGRRLYKYRSKVIAHRDQEISIRNFAKETGFTYNDLKKILYDTCSIFDTFAKKNNICGVTYFCCEEDLIKLISDLFEYNNCLTRQSSRLLRSG
ncbi:MAG: hypothetical protein HY742_02920 [Deltaproteobacteria bacterium]|nr:hypothetical protein [Deltaproteobacteria bacterium]